MVNLSFCLFENQTHSRSIKYVHSFQEVLNEQRNSNDNYDDKHLEINKIFSVFCMLSHRSMQKFESIQEKCFAHILATSQVHSKQMSFYIYCCKLSEQQHISDGLPVVMPTPAKILWKIFQSLDGWALTNSLDFVAVTWQTWKKQLVAVGELKTLVLIVIFFKLCKIQTLVEKRQKAVLVF